MQNKKPLLLQALIMRGQFKLTKKDLVKELITNGIAWIISMVVSFGLHQYFEEKSIKNLYGLIHKKNKVVVDKSTFGILHWVIIFVVGLFVFTYVERIMENYMKLREEKRNKE